METLKGELRNPEDNLFPFYIFPRISLTHHVEYDFYHSKERQGMHTIGWGLNWKVKAKTFTMYLNLTLLPFLDINFKPILSKCSDSKSKLESHHGSLGTHWEVPDSLKIEILRENWVCFSYSLAFICFNSLEPEMWVYVWKVYEGKVSSGARSASIQLKPKYLAFMVLTKWQMLTNIMILSGFI